MSIYSEQFDKVALDYDFVATLHNNNDFFLSNLSKNKGSALDIGCGSGVLSYELAKYYDKVVGVDVSKEMLAIANQKRGAKNIDYLYMDAHNLTLNTKFNLIASRTVFHHLDNIPSVINQLKKLLKNEGKIVIVDVVSDQETPNTIWYVLGAFKDFPRHWQQYGFSNGFRLLKFRISRHWLKHLAADKYLSESKFKQLYGKLLPNCSFIKVESFMSVVWENK